MLVAALRDLQWRRQRFLVAVLGAGLVFAMSMLMSGLASAFAIEIDRTLDQSGAEVWVAPAAAQGPFSAGMSIPLDQLPADLAAAAGVRRADPVLFSHAVADVRGRVVDVNLFGVIGGGLGSPRPTSGRDLSSQGEIVAPRRIASVGDDLVILGRTFHVVGTLGRASLIGGAPNVFVQLEVAQALVAGGRAVASMILADQPPQTVPPQLRAFTRAEVAHDLRRPLHNATRSIELVRWLLWIVAGLIVGSVVYLSALERTRDFAVFKATGVRTSAVALGVALQAVVIAVAASIVGGLLALVIAPRFPMDVIISSRSLLLLPVVAVAAGIVASAAGLRRVVQVEPAMAFGGP